MTTSGFRWQPTVVLKRRQSFAALFASTASGSPSGLRVPSSEINRPRFCQTRNRVVPPPP